MWKDTATGAAESVGFTGHQPVDIVSRTRALVLRVLADFFRLSNVVPESCGVNPASFSSRHPVWEGHATPVQGEGKPQYACSYCNTRFSGNAKDAMRHIRSQRCKIPADTKYQLEEEVNVYQQRKETLKNEKRKEGSSSKTAETNGKITLEKMDVHDQTKKLWVDLLQSQDYDIGNRITAVVVMAGSLLEHAQKLLQRGIHPARIARDYDYASKKALNHLEENSLKTEFGPSDMETFVQSCMANLSSKSTDYHCKRAIDEIAVRSVLEVSDLETKDVKLELIKVESEVGGMLGSTDSVKETAEDGLARENLYGTAKDGMIYIKKHANFRALTIVIPNVNEVVIEETKRSINDALWEARNLIVNNVAVPGGGGAEISCYITVEAASYLYPVAEQDVIRSFSDALVATWLALENRDLAPIEERSTKVDFVLESMVDKQQQIMLATHVGKMFNIKELT